MKAKTLILGVIATALPAFGMAGNELDMVVGTYTGAGSEGLYSFSFNQATGVARLRSTLEVKNPSYLAFARDGRHLYAVSENNDATAALNSIAFDPVTGNMSYMNSQLTYGKDPCYVDTDGKVALTANYSGGSLSVFPILQNGTLAKMTMQFAGYKGGPDRSRQATPHIHCVCFAPDGFVLATDFSADQILSFRYDKEKGTLLGLRYRRTREERVGAPPSCLRARRQARLSHQRAVRQDNGLRLCQGRSTGDADHPRRRCPCERRSRHTHQS